MMKYNTCTIVAIAQLIRTLLYVLSNGRLCGHIVMYAPKKNSDANVNVM